MASDDLAEKIRRGDEITADELRTVFKTADQAGVLYYKMLTMVREQRSLSELPDTLKRIIKTEAWKEWRWVGSVFGQNSLGSYLTSTPPNGVGIQLDTVEKLIADDPEALSLYRGEMTGQPHVHADHDNIIIKAKQGTSRAYTLDRLKREHTDLFDRVVTGELSANAAAKLAGWRKTPPPLDQIKKLWAKLDRNERMAHLNWTLTHCAECGQEGTWEGGIPEGTWCDACCEAGTKETVEGMSEEEKQQWKQMVQKLRH